MLTWPPLAVEKKPLDGLIFSFASSFSESLEKEIRCFLRMIGLGGSESIELFESFNSFFSGRSSGFDEFVDNKNTKSSSYSSEKSLLSCSEWFEADVTDFLFFWISRTGFEARIFGWIVRGFWKLLELNLGRLFPDLGLIFVDIRSSANLSICKSPKISFNMFALFEATLFRLGILEYWS